MPHKEKLFHIISLIKNNEWDTAHDLVQENEGKYDFDRLHAILHRMEGDDFNARWWYRKLKIEFPSMSIEEEIDNIKNNLLS